jgi:hypothetical protein
MIDEIRRAASVLFTPGDVIEVRVPHAAMRRTDAGYFSDLDRLAQAVESLERQQPPAVYWTLNPVNPALLARAAHKVKRFIKQTTTDQDVVRRVWLLVDLDPRRPAGISSIDAEHAAALQLGDSMRERLVREGWPEPMFADSGNGAHLVFRVDLPNDDESTELIKATLLNLSERFSSALVAVDTTTFNASRIVKAYGTTARKGDNISERPHRLSKMLDVPNSLVAIPRDLLLHRRVFLPASLRREAPRAIQTDRFDVRSFLDRHGVQFRGPVAYKGNRKFVLAECPFNPSHRQSAVFEAEDVHGHVGFHCFHTSCRGRTWREFRELLEPAADCARAGVRVTPPVGGQQAGINWRQELLETRQGEPRANLANAITALRRAPEWDGVLWRDEFAHRTVARKPTPWGPGGIWTDREDALTADWLQHQQIGVSREVAGQAVEVVAGDRPFHPVREYLNGVTWDGKARLYLWPHDHLGAEQTPYVEAVASRWMISAVARRFSPPMCVCRDGESQLIFAGRNRRSAVLARALQQKGDRHRGSCGSARSTMGGGRSPLLRGPMLVAGFARAEPTCSGGAGSPLPG